MVHSKKYIIGGIAVIVMLVIGVKGAAWLALFRSQLQPGEIRQEQQLRETTTPSGASQKDEGKMQIDTIATGLDTPWSIVFTSDERLLVAERPGRIRVIEKEKLLQQPLHTFTEVSETGEEGLMSLALSPQYPENHWLYVSLAYEKEGKLWVKVMRFEDKGNALENPVTLLDKIPAAQYHAGSRLAFGPDRKLYITTGDATNKALPQDFHSLAGKILRMNEDGSVPEDNPYPDSLVWSYGHRNPQGLAWQPNTGAMYSTEHGPSVFDGPAGGDEVNLIEKGKNYGWPLVSHEGRLAGTEAPLIVFTPAEAPASLLIYSGRQHPGWHGNLFFGALKGEGLIRLVLDSNDPRKIVTTEKLAAVHFGRIREVMEGPDGSLYFTTSNRDGRGKPNAEDDRVFRLHFGE